MNDELLSLLVKLIDRDNSPCCCSHNQCSDPTADLQFGHSLARFNDTSAQTVTASQQAFVQQQGAQFAQLLSLTAAITTE